jgi:hypothetical protein
MGMRRRTMENTKDRHSQARCRLFLKPSSRTLSPCFPWRAPGHTHRSKTTKTLPQAAVSARGESRVRPCSERTTKTLLYPGTGPIRSAVPKIAIIALASVSTVSSSSGTPSLPLMPFLTPKHREIAQARSEPRDSFEPRIQDW